MNSYNLARAFRPKKFSDIIGQKSAVQILKNIINNKISQQAFILVGTRGVGKTTIARIIAKALNCLNVENGEPCGVCDVCTQIENGSFMDCIEIDAASHTGVDNIREILDNSYFVPNYGKYKVYIIDEVHMLSKSAFNAMLKTLEEPPAHAVFVLATTELQKVPITILSRCLQLSLRNLSVQEICDHIMTLLETRNIGFQREAIELIAQKAYGSMRDALSITDRACAYSNNNITMQAVREILDVADRAHVLTLLHFLSLDYKQDLIEYANNLVSDGINVEDIMLQMAEALCHIQQMKLGIIKTEHELEFAKSLPDNNIQLYFEICNICLEQIYKSHNKNEIFIMCLLRMLSFSYSEYSIEDLKPNNSSNEQILVQKLEAASNAELKKKLNLELTIVNWPLIIKDIDECNLISDFLLAILQQTELLSHDNSSGKLYLGMEQSRINIVNDNILNQIKEVLEKYFLSRDIVINDVKIEVKHSLQNTLKQHNQEEDLKQMQAREELILSNKVVQEIVTKFDAKRIM